MRTAINGDFRFLCNFQLSIYLCNSVHRTIEFYRNEINLISLDERKVIGIPRHTEEDSYMPTTATTTTCSIAFIIYTQESTRNVVRVEIFYIELGV